MKSRRIVLAASALMLLPAAATANTADTVTDINRALKQQGESSRVFQGDSVKLPQRAENGVALEVANQTSVNLGLPAQGKPTFLDGLAVYKGDSKDNEIAIQKTADGVRALIHIDSPDAPERYEFPVNGAARLEKQPDGSVAVFDSLGQITSTVDAPWAKDKTGKSVPTHYEIKGTTLIQVVEHQLGDFEYGITADPLFVNPMKVAGCIAWGAVNLVPAGKFVKGAGGIYKAVKKTNPDGQSWR